MAENPAMTHQSLAEPSPWVVKHLPLIKKGGRVLDLACGNGRHAIWIAQQGYQVDAIDRDVQAVSGMLDMDNINVQILDIEAGEWPGPGQKYDGIVVSRYLYRPLLTSLPEILNSGGVLIYETFMVGNERYGKPGNPNFLLSSNELLSVYSPLLSIISFEQVEESNPKPAVIQRICGLKNLQI
jgi:SAM-dependent methyltransferase